MDLQQSTQLFQTETDSLSPVIERFFDTSKVSNAMITGIVKKIYRQEKQKPFVEKFVKYAGYPIWEKSMTLKMENSEITSTGRGKDALRKVIMIPLSLRNDSTVNAILKVSLTKKDTLFRMLYRWQYKRKGYQKQDSVNNADQTALLFMGMENRVFGHKAYLLKDTSLLASNRISDTIQIKQFGGRNDNEKLEAIGTEICYVYKCPEIYYARDYISPYCSSCETYWTWIDDGTGGNNGGTGDTPPVDPGTSGGAPDDGGWNENPCDGQSGGGGNVPITRQQQPCDDPPAWEPVEEPPILADDEYQLTADDIRIFNEIAAEDMAADESHFNKDCKGTLRGGNHRWPGTLAHWIIMVDYIANNPTYGEIEYAIPGSSAAGNRGYADMVNTQSNEIFEIKKYDDVKSGETEVDRYVLGANENCPVSPGSATPEWRKGVTYPSKNLPTNIPGQYLKVWFASSGVIAYKYESTSTPDPLPIVVPQSILDKLKTLVNKIRQNISDADRIIAEYLRANPELVNYIKTAAYTSAVAVIVGTIAEDIVSGGSGIADDWASFTIAYRIVRFAWKL